MGILNQNEDELDKIVLKRYIEERKREILLRRPDFARKIFLKRAVKNISKEIDKKIIKLTYERSNK